ncbi:MAG: SDR family oxidoreductase [Gemmatimonadota bacterium]
MVASLSADFLFRLQGKTVLLTGASGFLGRTMAEALLVNGARLVALGRSSRLNSLCSAWAQCYGSGQVSAHRVDMYDLAALERVLNDVLEREGALDVLINNAHELGSGTGFNTPDGSLENATYEQWRRNFEGAVYWPALTVQKVGSSMKERGGGTIINVSTMYAQVAPAPQLYEGTGFVNPPWYSAAKAGMLAFTRYVASFWGPYGVRCNAILPGAFSNTDYQDANSVPAHDAFLERLRGRTCLHRVGRPEELVGALLFLASDASSYVTGHALVVDGGWMII